MMMKVKQSVPDFRTVISLCVLLLLLAGICGSCTSSAEGSEPRAAYTQVKEQGALLLDVRTQEEYDQDNIEGATLIPVAELEARLKEIEQYKDKPILVYCRSGNRSMTASQILIENGFYFND